MLPKGLVPLATIIIVAVAMFGYTPVPEGLKDPYKFQLIMGYWKIHSLVTRLMELVTDNRYEVKIVLEGEPASSSFSDIQVKRENLSGVPVIIYRPSQTSNLTSALIYFHGDGWGSGSADVYDRTVYEYAKCSNSIVFSVDYRRAPKHPFPTPVQDCLDVTRYVLRHGEKLGVDISRVGVIGDSTGGNLAAAVALKLSKEQKSDIPVLRLQALHYPILQAMDLRLASYVDFNDTVPAFSAKRIASKLADYFGLDQKNNDYYATIISQNRHVSPLLRKSKYAEYMDVKILDPKYQTPNKTMAIIKPPFDSQVFSKVKQIVTNPLFSPLMSSDLSGVPTTFIHVCEFDVARDDALLYAERLKRAGVKLHLHFGKGGFHSDTVRLLPDFVFPQSGQEGFKAACGFINIMLKH